MLDIDIAALIVVFSVVWILVFILGKTLFKSVRKITAERESLLEGDRTAFQQATEACQRGLHEIEATLKSARQSADSIRTTLETDAAREKSRLISEVSAEYRSQVLNARRELDDKIQEIRRELEKQAGAFAESIERKLLS